MKVMLTWIFVILTGIITLVLNEKEFPHMCEHADQAMKEVWEGRAQLNKDVV